MIKINNDLFIRITCVHGLILMDLSKDDEWHILWSYMLGFNLQSCYFHHFSDISNDFNFDLDDRNKLIILGCDLI